MTVRSQQPGRGAAAGAAWLVAGLAVAATTLAVSLRPGSDIPWDAVVYPVLFCLPGALIARELPRSPVGWLLLFIGACFASSAFALQWLASGHLAANEWVTWWAERGSALLVPATVLLLLLLPDGRLPSRSWRLVVRIVLGIQGLVILLGWFTPGLLATGEDQAASTEGLMNPLGVLPNRWTAAIDGLVDPVLTVPLLLGIAAVVQRIRRPEGDQRQRLVGVLAGVAVFVLLVTVPDAAFPAAREWFHIAGATVLSGSVLTAVVRGRFERIQVVVSHGLVYGALTAVVLLAYVALVAASTRTGASDSLAGVLTAGVALALLPARRILQKSLRRAMYGDRGEPQRALRRLSSSVADSDDLAGLLHGLTESVRASLRARWVQAEFRATTASSGQRSDHCVFEEVALDGGDGIGGLLTIGLPAGRSLNPDERELVSDLADHGARAARVMCLATELSAARQTLVESREQERSRLRQDLHDDLGPILAGLAMQLGSLPELVVADAELARTRLSHLEAQALSALQRTRHISRDLRPPALDELGLAGALVEAGRALGVQVVAHGRFPDDLSPAIEVAVYRIGAEAMVNAQRHAGADEISLRLEQHGDHLTLEVADTGSGMKVVEAGVGLKSMRHRAAELGGTVHFLTTPGGGVTVRAVFPNPGKAVSE